MGKQYGFGTGDIYGVTATGASIKIGTLQNVQIGFSFDEKQLHGQKGFPVAVARGKGKIEGKWESGQLDVAAYNSLFFGESSLTAGGRKAVRGEYSVVPSTPFTITAANAGAGGADFIKDLGVLDFATGDSLTQVGSGATPSTGQYKVSAAGVYTFASADAGKKVLLSYIHATSTGSRLDITNRDMGAQPEFELILASSFQGKTALCHLFRCTSNKLDLPFKQDDFLLPESAFGAFANDSDQIGYMSFSG